MNATAAKLIASILLACLPLASMAAPGTPIGGIIVKGGKNPGGQMRALGTTDAAGNFTVEFAEGGEYRIEFSGKSNKEFGERAQAGVKLDYVIGKGNEMAADARRNAPAVSQQATFQDKIGTAYVLITVPQGGGFIRGTLRASDSMNENQAAERGINESGVSVKSTKPKGGIKR